MFKVMLMILVMAGFSGAHAQCYKLADSSDRIIYQSEEPPFDISYPPMSEDMKKSRDRGEYLLISQTDCGFEKKLPTNISEENRAKHIAKTRNDEQGRGTQPEITQRTTQLALQPEPTYSSPEPQQSSNHERDQAYKNLLRAMSERPISNSPAAQDTSNTSNELSPRLAATLALAVGVIFGSITYAIRKASTSLISGNRPLDMGITWASWGAVLVLMAAVNNASSADIGKILATFLVLLLYLAPITFALGWLYGRLVKQRDANG